VDESPLKNRDRAAAQDSFGRLLGWLDPDRKLLKYSWLQYLCWFGETEFAMSQGDARALASEWLRTAENNWLMLEDNNILMTEPKNDGKLWLRPWRQALGEFSSNS
jgi:hypothetical protein